MTPLFYVFFLYIFTQFNSRVFPRANKTLFLWKKWKIVIFFDLTVYSFWYLILFVFFTCLHRWLPVIILPVVQMLRFYLIQQLPHYYVSYSTLFYFMLHCALCHSHLCMEMRDTKTEGKKSRRDQLFKATKGYIYKHCIIFHGSLYHVFFLLMMIYFSNKNYYKIN